MKYLAALLVLLVVAGSLLALSKWRRPRQTVSGFVEAYDIRVGSRVGGRIDRVLVAEGDSVAAGQPLVTLAPYDLLERRDEAEAVLAGKRADLARLVAGPRPQEKEIARAQVDAAEATNHLAEAKFKRTALVYKQGQATADEMDQAAQQFRNAGAQLLISQQQLSLAQEGTRKEEIAAARAAVDAAQATLGMIQKQIDELTIKADVAGRIEALDLRPGDLVMANAPVLSMMDTSVLWIRAYVPENRLDLKIGQTVPVTIDSFPGRKFGGEITFVSREAEFTPRNVQTIEERSKQVFRIKVTLRGEALKELRPGMIGDVWLEGTPPGKPDSPAPPAGAH